MTRPRMEPTSPGPLANTLTARPIIIIIIISECRMKECKSRFDCLGNVILWALCKRLKLGHTHDIYTNQNMSSKMKRIRLSGT